MTPPKQNIVLVSDSDAAHLTGRVDPSPPVDIMMIRYTKLPTVQFMLTPDYNLKITLRG